MATMKDVARRAGVSTATVSRVINNTAYVEPVTRERVEKAMREFNYHRNAAALALAKRSGNMLGLLTGNLDDPFFSRLARGVEDITRQAGVRLMLCSGGHQAELEKSGLDFLINQGCEAIVAHVTRMGEEELLRYAAHTPALVLVNRYLPAIANRCIWLDNAKAAQAATELLIRQGHRRIACVTADLPIDDRAQRLAGYRKAMAAAGIEVPGAWIISVPFNEKGGELAAERVLASDPRFTAAVTFNDVMAAGMMRTCHQRHIQLPDAPRASRCRSTAAATSRRRTTAFRPSLSCETLSPMASRMSKASAANERPVTQCERMKSITWPVACAHILRLSKPLRCCSTPSSTGAVYG